MKKTPKQIVPRTSTTFELELKQKAEKKFKTYGISFSSGLSLLLTALIEEKIQIFK